jgi:hypothetical protein
MKVDDKLDSEKADALSRQIEDLFRHNPELTHAEILLACVIAICSVVGSIPCSGCAKMSARGVKKLLASELPVALTQAALERAKAGELPSGHVH